MKITVAGSSSTVRESALDLSRVVSDPGILAPGLIFAAVYVSYVGIGLLPLSPRGVAPPWVIPYYFLGLVGYLAGILAAGTLPRSSGRTAEHPWSPAVAGAALVLGLIGLIGIFATVGIPLAAPATRGATSPKLGFLVQLLPLGFVVLASRNLTPSVRGREALLWHAALLTTLGALGLTGYRSPAALLVLAYVVIWHYRVRPLRLREIGIALLAVAIVGSAFGYYRLQSGERSVNFRTMQRGTPAWVHPIIPLYLVAREGPLVFARSAEIVGREGFFWGRVNASIFVVALPGTQYGPRKIFAQLVGYKTETATPSIIGSFYADFGAPGIVLGLFLFGLVSGISYGRLGLKHPAPPVAAAGFAYLSAVLLLAIHAGLLDLSLITGIAVLLMLEFLPAGRFRAPTPEQS